MPINPLNTHYSMMNPVSSYDEEAMTALELASRTTGKVNEVVQAMNNLEETVDKRLDEIPDNVRDEFSKNVDNGVFDEMIDEYAGEITERVDNLVRNYTPGSTTADAEIIDARINGDGNEHANAGAATRATYANVKSIIDYIANGAKNSAYEMHGTQSAFTWLDKFFIASPGVQTPTDSSRYKIATFNVDELSFYKIHACANYNNLVYMVRDGNGQILDGRADTNGTATLTIFDDYIFTPKNARMITVAWYSNPDEDDMPLEPCYKIDYICMNDDLKLAPDIVKEYMRLLNTGIGTIVDVNGVSASVGTLSSGYVIVDGVLSPINDSTLTGYFVNQFFVKPGQIYHVKACANYENYSYVVRDKNGNIIVMGGKGSGGVDYTLIDEVICMPTNAHQIHIAYNTNIMTGHVLQNLSFVARKKWAGKKWTCIGDSNTETNIRASKKYHDYIAEETGIAVRNLGASGVGFLAGGVRASHVHAAGFATGDDVITLFGSFNDLSFELGDVTDTDTSTVCGAINVTLTKAFDSAMAKGQIPRFAVISPTPWATATPNDAKAVAYVDALKTICERRGIPFLDLFRMSNLHPESEAFRKLAYTRDDGNGVHPDEHGHAIIAPIIEEFISKLL